MKKPQIILFCIILLGTMFRTIGINWDQGYALHPDERMIMMVTEPLTWADPNPDFYNYGHLPIYLLKGASSIAGTITPSLAHYPDILLVGRLLSILFDVGTIILIFYIGKKLVDTHLGLASSFVYACAVTPIQNAHFYIVDPQLTFWITLLLLLAVTYVRSNKVFPFALMGIVCGLAAATKFTGILTLIAPITVILLRIYLNMKNKTFTGKQLSIQTFGFLIITLTFATILFLVTQPFLLLDLAKYWHDISLQLTMSNDASIFPYTIQFLNTPAYIHPLKGILVWGLGLPITALVLIGLYSLLRRFRRITVETIVLLVFALVFFGILGQSAVKFMRYYLPLYPILSIVAGYGVYYSITAMRNRSMIRNLIVAVVVLTLLLWPIAFIQIYLSPNTRIEASDWINQNIAQGSTIATEHWDDILPLRDTTGFTNTQLKVYQPETTTKWKMIADQLNSADYLIISSKRVYRSIQNWPGKYPITVDFYRKLFSNQAEFTLLKTFTSYPRIGGIEISDDNSPESFTIFDHPKVWIFAKSHE